jgi:hypothetical protein
VSWLGITIRFGHRGRLGTYSAKLLNGTRQRFSGFSQLRQCGDDVLRMLVTGGPPVRGGGGMPQRALVVERILPNIGRARGRHQQVRMTEQQIIEARRSIPKPHTRTRRFQDRVSLRSLSPACLLVLT